MRRLLVLIAAVVVAALLLARASCDEPEAPQQPEAPDAAPQPSAHERARPPRVARPVEPAAPAEPDVPEAKPAEEESPAAAPAAEGPEVPGELPDAELGEGPGVLTLRLVDEATGEPVESAVRLWRLGVGGSERWGPGDHVQRKVGVPPEGATIAQLPLGTYRVEVDVACAAADDPPAFTVDGVAAQTLYVQLPRRLPIRCVVFGEDGRRFDEATITRSSLGTRERMPRPAPGWSAPRPRIGEEPPARFGGRMSMRSGRTSPSTERAGPDGFDALRIREASRLTTYRGTATLRFGNDRAAVEVAASSDDVGRGVFVGVAPPVERVAGHVFLPDGRSAIEAGVRIDVTCRAMRTETLTPEEFWRSVAVDVHVEAPGCEPLLYAWHVDDPPPDRVTLRPK